MMKCRDAWEDVLSAPCLFILLTMQYCCCYSSLLFVCFVGLYAGHPYINLISVEIFLLAYIIIMPIVANGDRTYRW